MGDSAAATEAGIDKFIENFLTAVDFQEAVDLKADTEIASLSEWDSLAALGVIVMFDMEYGKTITGQDLKAAKTIADLFALTK
jgi:acyl carrier protein